jgi:site-specific DNA recombinase
MQPEHVATFVVEFTAEWNRLQAEISAHDAAQRRELEVEQRKLAVLIEGIADGIRAQGLQQRLDELGARKAALELTLCRANPGTPASSEAGRRLSTEGRKPRRMPRWS